MISISLVHFAHSFHQSDPTANSNKQNELWIQQNGLKGRMEVFCTKEPTFERGQYRLNFRGRVTTPSVKNFQIVHTSHDGASQSPNSEVIVQFGRVSDNTFHLDFKKPFNMFQAFGIALAQFDL